MIEQRDPQAEADAKVKENEARIKRSHEFHDRIAEEVGKANADLVAEIDKNLRHKNLVMTPSPKIFIREELSSKILGVERKTTIEIGEPINDK